MADDKDKQQYSYRPEIEYQDTYKSDFKNRGYQPVQTTEEEDIAIGNEITNSITDTFNQVTNIIPLLPANLQTVINGVYKPILDSWATMNKNPYPQFIPDPDGVTYEPYTPEDTDPWQNKFIYPISPDLPEPTLPDEKRKDHTINNAGIWDPHVPMVISFNDVHPKDIIDKEFIKNVADLYSYYSNRLKDILFHYHSEVITAIFAKKRDADGNLSNKTVNDVNFIFSSIRDNSNQVDEDSKHLFDAGISMNERAALKLNFISNAFPVEQTLYHLKNFKAVYLLRKRYAEIDDVDGSNKIDSMSNNILKGMKLSYDQKYDVAYMNLYKYLNSSLDILEDALNTDLAGIRAKRTLIEKGGIKR